MDASAFAALLLACAPLVHAGTAHALVGVESSFNPWAIGVVGGQLQRRPRHRAEALATARSLQSAGWNFSVGLGQINLANFGRLGLTLDSAFDPCTNLRAMQTVLHECFVRARTAGAARASAGTGDATGVGTAATDQPALRRALSCYYSGNFATGFRHGYVHKVATAAAAIGRTTPPRRPTE